MTPPVRPKIHVLSDFPKEPETMTLREAVEWTKAFSYADLGTLTAIEAKYMNDRWVIMLKAIAEREGVPVGYLSQMLDQLARSELELQRVAAEEAGAAMSYGQSQ